MKKLMVLLTALVFGLSLWAATTGSSETNAKKITVSETEYSTTVTLVAEDDDDDWDWDDDWDDDDWDDDWDDDDWGDSVWASKSWSDFGVYYFSASLKKGKAYTIWIEGSDAAEIDLSAYAYGEMSAETPAANFSDTEIQVGTDGKTRYMGWMEAESWAEDDASSWTYYFCLSGDVGQKTTFHIVEGEKSFLADGVSGNPKRLTFTESAQTESFAITAESNYWFKAELKTGRKYLIRTTTGTQEDPLVLTVEYGYITVENDPDYASDKWNTSLAVYPTQAGQFLFKLKGPQPETPFTISYQAVPTRAITDHTFETLVDNVAKTFKPGREESDKRYYDTIIDECLFRFSAAKNERWIISAEGADRKVEMRLYDANGNILKTNKTVGDGTHDVLIGYDITADSYYYVGVCDPSLSLTGTVVCADTRIVARRVTAEEDTPETIAPTAGKSTSLPVDDGQCVGPNTLDDERWTRTFKFAARKDLIYRFAVRFADPSDVSELDLKATILRYSGSVASIVRAGATLDSITNVSYKASANATYGIRISVDGVEGVDYPAFNLYADAIDPSGSELAALKVTLKGSEVATWSLNNESVKYESGDSVLLPKGTSYTVKYASVSGLTKPDNVSVTAPAEIEGVYNDTYDPKDDTASGATSLSISATTKTAARTLWEEDACDWFSFSTKDGVYSNFELQDLKGDAAFSIYEADGRSPAEEPVEGIDGVTSISRCVLGAGKYFLCVKHFPASGEEVADSSYTLAASSANVGAIQFAKQAVSTKKTAGSVSLSVKRTAKEGRVRVKYTTVAGTAEPGVRYVAQNGVLEWASGDGKAKTITIDLIPDLVAVYAGDTSFDVTLEAIPDADLESDEYPAQITVDTCTVTIKETAKSSVTSVEDAYTKTAAKVASVKTEDTALRVGTFFGVLSEDGSQLTNGLPKVASVTVTTTSKDKVTAKIALAGKSYSFKSSDEEWADAGDGYKQIVLTDDEDELTITVKDGQTTDANAWTNAGGWVELVMDVPDVKGKGVQEGIRYRGEIFRQNAKIDDYLKAVADKFYGYYTLALVPEGVSSADGIPAGNGYLTIKVDNKGTATVAGLLADGTKVNTKVTAAAIKADALSANGYAMYLPVYQAKSPYCFGGVIKLTAKEGETLPSTPYVRVVDSTAKLVWNNDNISLTYYNEDGWRITCSPVGGWYDTVMNLEAYYLNYALSVETADISEFPTEQLASDEYSYVTDVQPTGEAVSFANDVLSAAKRSLTKVDKLYDLVNSVNPCNVQVKLTRSTGVVTGSFSLWSENDSGTQKEIKSIKHNGVLLLSRDDFAALDDEVISAGYCSAKVTLTEENESGKTVSRKWTYSLPFNLLGVDQGVSDPWEQDGGWNPSWGEEPQE